MSKTEQRPAEPVTLRAALGEVINGIFSKLTSPSTFNVLCTGFLAASLLIFSLLSSIIASIYFYNTFIPPLSVSRPVFLQYGAGVPFGSVQLGPSVLSSGQSYIVFLELEAPASQRNLDVGNFMAALTVFDAANNTLAYTSRPASLEYKSFVYRTIRQMWGMTDVQKLRLPLLERFVPGPASSALLSVGRPQAELHTYGSKIVFDAHFSGLRYLMHSHRITAFVVLSTTFFFCELVSALVAWALLVHGTSSSSKIDSSAHPIEAKHEEPPQEDRKPSLKELTDRLDVPTSPEIDDLLSSQDEDPDKKPNLASSSSIRQRRRSASRADRSVFDSLPRSKQRAPADEALVSPSDEESTSSEDPKPFQGQDQPERSQARDDVKDEAEEDNILLDTSPPNSGNEDDRLGGGRKDQ